MFGVVLAPVLVKDSVFGGQALKKPGAWKRRQDIDERHQQVVVVDKRDQVVKGRRGFEIGTQDE